MTDTTAWRLEKDYQEPFRAWKTDPNPETTQQLLQKAAPAIEAAAIANVGYLDPLVKSRARRRAYDAIQRYDPEKTQLNTYLTNQLMSLRRDAHKREHVLAVPQRIAQERRIVWRTQADLQERLGREPSATELAAAANLSLPRLEKIMRYRPDTAVGGLENHTEQRDDQFTEPAVRLQTSPAYLQAIYDDASPQDQFILERTLGLFGKRPLSNQDIARRLNLSPGAVSQRKAKLQQQLDSLYESKLFGD